MIRGLRNFCMMHAGSIPSTDALLFLHIETNNIHKHTEEETLAYIVRDRPRLKPRFIISAASV